MLELLCPATDCGERTPMTEQVQTDDRVIWTGECQKCGCEFEREDEPGEIKITKEPEE